MNDILINLSVMLVEDDKENLDLLMQSLPTKLANCNLQYDPYYSFETATEKLKWQRYDLVITDIYRNRGAGQIKNEEEDVQAIDIVQEIRKRRFCPVVAFTDGSFPESIKNQTGPFLKLADKTKNDEEIISAIQEILETKIPQIARAIHDEIDHATGPKYLWEFLENNWENLRKTFESNPVIIERLIRRRAAIQLGRLDPTSQEAQELQSTSAAEFYVMPPLAPTYRLGHVLRLKENNKLFVVATPHCHLTVQPKDVVPRAEQVLLVSVLPFLEVIKYECTKTYKVQERVKAYKSPWKGDEEDCKDKLRRYLQSPSQLGVPTGRYWFLPGLIEIPDSLCDFMNIKSVPFDTLASDYESLAVIDTPFAEAFQSCFLSFYSSIGLPNQLTENYTHLLKDP